MNSVSEIGERVREGKRLGVKIKNRVAMMCFDVENKRWKNIDDTLVHHWKWIKTTISLIKIQANSFASILIHSDDVIATQNNFRSIVAITN